MSAGPDLRDFTLVDASTRFVCIEAARVLMKEYIAWLGIDLSFQNVDEELAGLPGEYVAPLGGLWLLTTQAGPKSSQPIFIEGAEVAGVIALRPLDHATIDGAGEVKRLWVRPAFRGRAFGEALAAHLIEHARSIGYKALYLDTLARMKPAIGLYTSLGFRVCDAYYANPEPDVVYMSMIM